jgi:hypothetical protein
MNELLVEPPAKTCDVILLQSMSEDVYHALTTQHHHMMLILEATW